MEGPNSTQLYTGSNLTYSYDAEVQNRTTVTQFIWNNITNVSLTTFLDKASWNATNSSREDEPCTTCDRAISQSSANAYVITMLSVTVLLAVLFTIFGLFMKAEAHVSVELNTNRMFPDERRASFSDLLESL